MKNIENLVGRMHQKSGHSRLNREGLNVCIPKAGERQSIQVFYRNAQDKN